MELATSPIPRAFAALEGYPALYASVAASLRRQAALVAARAHRFIERPTLLEHLSTALANPHGGLILLEGLPGSGVSSLLCNLAVKHLAPLWLAGDDSDGALALYAQIVALYRPGLPLIDPAAATDPTALERLLAEIAAGADAPISLLVDLPADDGQPELAQPPCLPANLPPGVTMILGCTPGYMPPYRPALRLRLPTDDGDLVTVMATALAHAGLSSAARYRLIAAARGSFLYLTLACAAIDAGVLDPAEPPAGLDGLLGAWWQSLDMSGRSLALLLASASEPLPLNLATEILGVDPQPQLARWAARQLVDLNIYPPSIVTEEDTPPTLLGRFAHPAIRGFLAHRIPKGLAKAHAAMARYGVRILERGGWFGESRRVETGSQCSSTIDYFARQLARHAALAGPEIRNETLPRLLSRDWIRAQERRIGLKVAQRDIAWELRAASADGVPLRVARAAALAGTLATRARSLSADAVVEALSAGFEHSGREAALKRVISLVERLPDDNDKAQILRRLGEACYGARMRSSAMRLLSRALDLEAHPISRSWREQREQLLASLATAALEQGDCDIALLIAERIEHLERRAVVETQVVRQMLSTGDLDKAQRVARSILHESMGAWARAEVAVALVRSRDSRGTMMMEEISLETVAAWAQIELACDDAVRDEASARARIDALSSPGQRDRGLARLAHALALAEKDGDALAAAEQITGVEARVTALLDLRLTLEGLVAMLAIEQATSDIGALQGDDRAPLVAALAAAHAALGRQDRALKIVDQLTAGEERDRALAKVAVALAQRGEHDAAEEILNSLGDEDERDWARDEIVRLLAGAGHWDSALTLAGQIGADEQRLHTLADLAIEHARCADPAAGHDLALTLESPAERARALTLIAPLLVHARLLERTTETLEHPGVLASSEARARYQAIVAGALAEHGLFDKATALINTITRPAERARAGISLARSLANTHPRAASRALGAALQSSAIGREEALRALEHATPTLAQLGGAFLLSAVATAVDEIDHWM